MAATSIVTLACQQPSYPMKCPEIIEIYAIEAPGGFSFIDVIYGLGSLYLIVDFSILVYML